MLLFDTLIMKSPERSRQEIFYFCSLKNTITSSLESGTWNPPKTSKLIFRIRNNHKKTKKCSNYPFYVKMSNL